MSDRVSGRPRRVRLASRVALVLGFAGLLAGPGAPIVGAADPVTVTTPYPEVVAEPGSTATFKLILTAATPSTVSLTAEGVPTGWTVRFHGNGMVIASAYVSTGTPPDVSLSVDVPQDAQAGRSPITVVADGGGVHDTFKLSLVVNVESAAAGDVTLTPDFPELKGASSAPFNFNVTLKNGTPTETTFAVDASGPAGWTITAKPSGSAQATSTIVPAGSSTSIAVAVSPAADVAAGSYPVRVNVSGGGKTASLDLKVTVTGSYALAVSTPDQVLSTSANAGTEKDFQLTLTNGGTAPITQVTPSATAPNGWKVTFDPATIDSIDTKTPVPVTAKIVPSADAIAGDYNVVMTAAGAEASGNVTIRVRVETPQFWWIAGIVLIGATFAGLYWVFRTYGRR